MSRQWFRLYAEFATDPKVQMLSEAMQRRFVMLMCLRCSNDDVTLQDEEVAFQLRISNDEWNETKDLFLSKGLILEDNTPAAWDRRQFQSDTSNERVKAWRERQKSKEDKGPKKRNVTVTPPDTDTDTDTDTEKGIEGKPSISASAEKPPDQEPTPDPLKPKPQSRFAEWWEHYPKKADKKEAEKVWRTKRLDAKADELIADVDRRSREHRTWLDGYIPNPTTYLRRERWNDEIERIASQGEESHAEKVKRQLRESGMGAGQVIEGRWSNG